MCVRAVFLTAAIGFAAPAAAEGLYPPDPEFGPETLSLVAVTEALFDALENESAENASTPRIELRRAGPEKTALPPQGRNALRNDLGPVENLTGYGITWYPTQRLSGTVDFVGTWGDGRNLLCGYVTWDMTDPDVPRLASMTTSYLDTKTLVRLPANAAHAELLRGNCAFGEIEPNLDLARG